LKPSLDSLLHYGVARKSGRYPYGSGEDPRQGGNDFLSQYESLMDKGLSQVELASRLGMNTRQLRESITRARAEQKQQNAMIAKELNKQGLSGVEIGKRLGVSEGTVRNYLSEKTVVEKNTAKQLENIGDAIRSGAEKTGYLDVGVGVERQLGISRTKFNTVVNSMVESGEYNVHEIHVQRLSDPTGTKYTTIKVLTKDPDIKSVYKKQDQIRPLDSWSDDGSASINKLKRPDMIDLKRVHIRYKEDGGADKDGLIELRPGVPDLDLGVSKYAQVRIAAGENLYMKGMAAYSTDKFPDGADIIYNTNKSKGTPPEKVLKTMQMHPKDTDDPNFMFGSAIARQKGALNVVNEQGEWDKWSSKLSSQFLSKQPLSLIKDRLDDTHASLRKELNEIASMTNPVVKQHLLNSESSGFIGSLDKKASHLKAKGLPNTKSHVLMPFPDMNPNEIYATNFKDGDRVALVRHPHGGRFEIPELVVNNKHKKARDMLGQAIDAVGIHPSVAEKLSGADFDGDTALVIPNNKGLVKSSRTLKELKNFDPKALYQRDYETISQRTKEIQMGMVSNLITDMTIKGASDSEIARAVRHSMVVIDAEKHKLDYKQSAKDNAISSLVKKYQTDTNPDTGKVSKGASTLISRSKQKIDISQHDKVRVEAKDKVSSDGRVLKKGLSVPELASKYKISDDTVKGYLEGKEFTPDRYSSGYSQDVLYTQHIKNIQVLKNEALKIDKTIILPSYSKEAAKVYKNEIDSLDQKLHIALLNAPRERQAQLLTNKLFFSKVNKGMDKDDVKKLKTRALAAARVATGASRSSIKITDMEWEAIQAKAVSNTKLKEILKHSDMDVVRQHATPRERVFDSAKVSRARTLLNNGFTYAQVAETMGVSTSTLREEIKSDG
jgi:predicted transcriptional regulator